MSMTLEQIFVANPITSNAATDLMYFSQSPYTAGHDAGMTYANFSAQFVGQGLAVLKAPAGAQTITGAFNLIMATGSMVAPTMLPGNLSLTGNTLSSTDSNGNINIIPNGTGMAFIGTSTNINSSLLQLAKSGIKAEFLSAAYINDSSCATHYFYKSRNATVGSHTAIQTGDSIGRKEFYGDDGTNFVHGASILVQCADTVSAGVMPTEMEFYTTTSAGVFNVGMTLTKDQNLVLANSLLVASGGSGRGSSTAYGLIAGGITSTGTQQSLSTGTAGQLLTSGGASALPAWTTATFPATAGSAGTILRSNGTNFVNSTATFADTYGASTLLYSNGANTVAGLATANNGLLVTSNTGVPSISNVIGADISVHTIFLGNGGQANSTYILGNYTAPGGYGSGDFNTGIGFATQVGSTQTTAQYNVSVGAYSLETITSAQYNAAVGAVALSNATTASFNTAIGALSGRASGLAIGTDLTTGTYNTLIGYGTAVNSASALGVLCLGAQALGNTATGNTSGDIGAQIAIGSSTYPVGVRGDGSLFPTAGIGAGTLPLTFTGYWRVTINGTNYKIPLYLDA